MDQKRINGLIQVFRAQILSYFCSSLGWSEARVTQQAVHGAGSRRSHCTLCTPNAEATGLVSFPGHFSMWIQFSLSSLNPPASTGRKKKKKKLITYRKAWLCPQKGWKAQVWDSSAATSWGTTAGCWGTQAGINTGESLLLKWSFICWLLIATADLRVLIILKRSGGFLSCAF